jgi:hypothetical protein
MDTNTNLKWARDRRTGEYSAESTDGRFAFIIVRTGGAFDLFAVVGEVILQGPCFRGTLTACEAMASDMTR